MHHRSIVIVTPALADANNGNWQTARRWARMLSSAYRVTLTKEWTQGSEDLMIALHARRSAASVAAWRQSHLFARPLLLALTGTDLYRDIAGDDDAKRSLQWADQLVVLNELGAQQLAPALRERCAVVLQSCSQRAVLPKPRHHLRAVTVGHLRDEKDPRTLWRAVERLAHRPDILVDHIGAALDPALAREARALAGRHPQFRWLGALPHEAARRRIQRASVLVHPSRMEGGAHVVIEAVRSGTAVLASRIDGNLGLLGVDHPATFAVGDDQALAGWLERLRDEPAILSALQQRSLERSARFAPESEAATLHALVAALLAKPPAARTPA